MNLFQVRRARVRPAFAGLYPEIVPGVWMSAKRATRLVLQRLYREPFQWQPGTRGRVLCDEHFEFRGGRSRRHPGNWTPRAQLPSGLDVAIHPQGHRIG
jgi:hypothetical protein